MRDFRDAKAMAHALRDALKSRAVETTHSECLELIAKVFGYDNWNILSAKIEAAEPRGGAGPAPVPPGAHDPTAQSPLYCTFCAKPQHEVRMLIAGPSSTYICEECVDVCNDVVGHQDDQVVLDLFKAGEESGNQAHPAVFEYVRSKSTEGVVAYAERARKGAERHRAVLHYVQQRLAMQDGEVPAKGEKKDLLALQQQAERLLKLHETGLRIATTVLGERGQQISSRN